jgi:hypothetical protein
MFMSNTDDTQLTLTGIYSGLKLNMSALSGLVSKAATATGQTGYKISRDKTSGGVSFDVVSVAGAENVPEPANFILSVEYSQSEIAGEIDLEVRYADIPSGSELQVESSEPKFSITRQQIHGSSLIGKQGTDLGTLTASLELKLWVVDPAVLKATSRLTMSFSKIEDGSGPVKKILLQKIQVDLAN